jgi:hypothetical protein
MECWAKSTAAFTGNRFFPKGIAGAGSEGGIRPCAPICIDRLIAANIRTA